MVPPEYHGIRTARYLYVEYVTGEKELYDVRRDPAELHNLASTANPQLVAALSAEVARLKTCRAAACRAAESHSIVG